MKKQMAPLEMMIGLMMRAAVKSVKKQLHEAGIPYTVDQLTLLHAIHFKNGELIQQDMADFMGKDKSAVLRIIDSLEKDGLLVRVVDAHDRRKKTLVITAKGKQVVDHFVKAEYSIWDKLQKGVTKEELDIFQQVIQKIQINAERWS